MVCDRAPGGGGRVRRQLRAALVVSTLAGALLALPSVASAHGGGNFAAPAGTTPTIDGTIGTGEWSDASAYSLTFGSAPATLRFKVAAGNLYVGASVQDPSPGSNPSLSIFFDEDHDGASDAGDDAWLSFVNIAQDYFNQGAGYANDESDGGTTETSAVATSSAGNVTFEISHPLCSADTAHDICAVLNQVVGVDFQYEPGTTGVFYNTPGPDLFNPSNNWADLGIGADITPPDVSVTQPAAGAILRGEVRLSASANDDVGISRVDFIYRGRLTQGGPLVDTVIGSATNGTPGGAPYYVTFDTTQFPNTLIKDATIFARAYDDANNSTLAVGHAVTLDNTGPGQIVFESDRDGNSEIWSMNPDGANLKQLTHTASPVVNTRPAISPDGRTVVFERTSGGATQVYSIKYDGTNEQQLTTGPGNSGAPAFSPDGTKIAFHSDRATPGKRQIYVMNAGGSGQTRVTNDSADDENPSWNNDGTQLVIDSDRSGSRDIWKLPVANPAAAVNLTQENAGTATDPDWSPDGQTILFVSDVSGKTSVWKMNADGTGREDLTRASGYDADVAWAPDGNHLAFVRDAGGQDFNVWTARPSRQLSGPDNTDFGIADLRLTDVCIGYTIAGTTDQTYTIQAPPSSANCNITQDRSVSGSPASTVTFDNQSGRTVDIYWLDYEGNRVYYNTLGSPGSYAQPTYNTHPWVMIAKGPWRNSFPDWGPAPVAAPVAKNLSLTASPTSSTAGAAQVKLADVPPLALILPQGGLQSSPVNQTPVNQSPVNQTPINQLAATTPVNQSPVNQSPINQSPVNQTGFAELTQTIPQLGNVTLSTIPLTRSGGWAAVLNGTTLAGLPEQSVTLQQVYALSPLPPDLRPNATNPIKIGELDLSHSPLGTMPAIAFALGRLPLSDIPWTTSTSSGTYASWCTAAGLTTCSGSTATVLSAGLQGAPVNQTPVNQTPVNQSLIQALATYTPINQTPVNQTPINQSQIGALPVNQTPVNQTPVNQLSLQAIMAANAPVNQSPVNQTPVNQLPVNQVNTIVDCGLVDCASPTTTLGSAYAAHAIRNVTLGDLRAIAPASLLASWTIAALRYYGNMTIGDLLSVLPQPNSFTLADVLLLVLGSPSGAQGLSFEGINIFDTGLQQVASGPTIAYRGQFTVSPNPDGGQSGVANTVAVTSTLGTNFLYVPGTSKLYEGASCSSATAIGDPTSTRLNDGRLKLTWPIPTIVGKTYSVCFTARPGLVIGPQGASLDAQPADGDTASATPTSVDIGDTLEANDPVNNAKSISTDSFYLSYLTSASDVDYYTFTAPAAGTVVTFHLSHLPTDYDLVVYGPAGTALRPPLSAGAVPLDEAPLTDSGVDATSASNTLPSQTLDDLRLQTDLPMVGVSASRGTDPEDVVVISQGTGTYTVQITGYNGATSPKPYMLRVATTPPRATANVTQTTVTGTVGPALPTLPTGLNTVFLVNRQRLQSFYSDARATNVMNALANDRAAFTSLGFPNVVLSVDRFTAVQNAYATWNQTGSASAANGVVKAINGVLDSQIRSQPNGAGLKYLVIVGGDKIIPFARLDDFTVTASNETGYASTFATNSDLFASLNAGQMLSDDPYGDVNPVPYLTRQLYIPELAVGRLVETPEDIIRTLNNFVSPAVAGRLAPSTSLTTGYDFLYDGASAVNSPFSSRFGTTNAKTLFDNPAASGDNWTLSDLIGAFLPTTGAAPSITSLNGHASHFQFQPPNHDDGTREQLFTTSTLTASNASLANRLIFSMGCHAGLSVADSIVTATTLDWAQAFAQKGVGAFLGNTGYGYGDSLVVAYSEELNRLFAQRIAAGSAVGDALTAAKQAYYGELGVFGVYDEKAMAEFTLYGLPMWSVSAPAGGTGQAQTQAFAAVEPTGAPQAAALNDSTPSAQSAPIATDPTTGLDAESFSVDPLPLTARHDASGRGSYWSGPDGVQITHFRPIQPKALVGLSGTTGHGALITELTSDDTNTCIDPVFARPVVDLSATESEFSFSDVAFPSKLQTVRTFETPTGRTQQLVLVTGQFFTQPCAGNPQVGVQRLFSHIAGRVFRSTSNDYISPAFQLIEANKAGGNVSFIVDVTDKSPGTVKQVIVAVRSGSTTDWTFVNLAHPSTNLADPRWTGGTAISGDQFEYFVQAVDVNGNVGVSTNKGFYFAQPPPPPDPTGNIDATLSGPQNPSGWYTSAPTLTVSAPAGVTTQVSVDGGAYGPAPSTITGDGLHTVDIRASNGGTAELLAPVDTSAPTIVINTPVQNAQYVLNSVVKADYVCLDAGSGVSSCPVSGATNGNIDTSSVGMKSFVVGPASDRAGHIAPAVTVNYTVVRYRKVLFSSARTGGGDIYAMNADGTATATRLTTNNALEEQPSWSPDGSKIAFARATAKNNLDIYVMDSNGANVKQLTFASNDDTAPSWSADGSKIAFQTKRDGNPEIYVMNNDGTGQKRLTFTSTQEAEPAWSPNGQKITFLSNRNGTLNVWVMNSNGTSQTQLTATSQPDATPSFSPDGTKILFASKRGTNMGTVFDIYTMNPDGSNVARLTNSRDGDFEPSWSRDGTKIAFSSLRAGNQEIYTMDASGAQASVVRLTNNPAADNQPDW